MAHQEETLHYSGDMRDRVEASLPADDPRFAEMRSILMRARQMGRSSPAARMLGEWALLGYLLTTGRIALGGESSGAVTAAQQDLASITAAQAHVDAALKGFEWE